MARLSYTAFFLPSTNKTYIPAFKVELDGDVPDCILKDVIYHKLMECSFERREVPEDNTKNLNVKCEDLLRAKNVRQIGTTLFTAFQKSPKERQVKLSKEFSLSMNRGAIRHLLNKVASSETHDYSLTSEIYLTLEAYLSELGFLSKEVKKHVSASKKELGRNKAKAFIVSERSSCSAMLDKPSYPVYVYPVINENKYCIYIGRKAYLYDRDPKAPPALVRIASSSNENLANSFSVSSLNKLLTKDGVPPYIVDTIEIPPSIAYL